MKEVFDNLSFEISKLCTRTYSTSFTLGIRLLDKKYRDSIYNIYGYVRFADEIVDSFHEFDKRKLLNQFKIDTHKAIEDKISLNPILNSFQKTVNENKIDIELIDIFLNSMEMDLIKKTYNNDEYQNYIVGSAEVVGLMCLKVFVEGDEKKYNELKYPARKLGAAFQKINFLRDLKTDIHLLGRTYFPNLTKDKFKNTKQAIEKDIEFDINEAIIGIQNLPEGAKKGVHLAYTYYNSLFEKIKSTPANVILEKRIRINNGKKIGLMFHSLIKHQLNIL
jgi:phytoene/squalene synthetase